MAASSTKKTKALLGKPYSRSDSQLWRGASAHRETAPVLQRAERVAASQRVVNPEPLGQASAGKHGGEHLAKSCARELRYGTSSGTYGIMPPR